jgi:hypothetical protein
MTVVNHSAWRIKYLELLDWAYKQSFLKQWRTQRFLDFVRLVRPPEGARILDLGGLPTMWDLVPHTYQVTLLNLPGFMETQNKSPEVLQRLEGQLKCVEGDATALREVFQDGEFDVVYSNSVIEHVGGEVKQAAFAAEAQRLGKGYWVQTPSPWFPLEAHTGVLFYWQRSQTARDILQAKWSEELPDWTEMVRGTTVLGRDRMKVLFPDASFYAERKLLFEKSYAAYRAYQ